MQKISIFTFILLILFVWWVSGCSYTLQFDTEYASQSGDGGISERSSQNAKTEQSPKVDTAIDIKD